MTSALSLLEIEKSFGPVAVLRGVSLEVKRGEVHALLGQNGAGKSTLMRILLGLERADRGAIVLADGPYAPRGPADARERGVVMVPQERTLCPALDVVENIVLGIEPSASGLLRRKEAHAIASRALGLVAGDGRIPLAAPVRALSVADQQLVEIARALAQGGLGTDAEGVRAKVLVLDEPTASLGKSDADRLFLRVRALADAGLAIVLVTHFLSDVREHADGYTVLRDGKVCGSGDAKTTAPEKIVHAMLGRELDTERGDADVEGAHGYRGAHAADVKEGEPLLELRAVAGKTKPRDASFVLRRGEILGIAGLVGSGRTELLRAILGLDPTSSGKVVLTAPRGIGLLSEDRGGEGLMLGRSVADNIELSARGPFMVRPARVDAEGARWISELSIRASGPAQRTGDLSGGNQQKVQIARLLREDYDVLLVDEPTRGIDVASKAQVLDLLRTLARRGKGVVLVSSQLEELVATCDRIAVLRRGVLSPSRPVSEWTEQKLLLEAAS